VYRGKKKKKSKQKKRKPITVWKGGSGPGQREIEVEGLHYPGGGGRSTVTGKRNKGLGWQKPERTQGALKEEGISPATLEKKAKAEWGRKKNLQSIKLFCLTP